MKTSTGREVLRLTIFRVVHVDASCRFSLSLARVNCREYGQQAGLLGVLR